MRPRIVDVSMRREKDWHVATARGLPGLFVANPDAGKVAADVPVTVEALFRAQYGVAVRAVRESRPPGSGGPSGRWVAVPVGDGESAPPRGRS